MHQYFEPNQSPCIYTPFAQERRRHMQNRPTHVEPFLTTNSNSVQLKEEKQL
jgi:hypothetical protein